MGELGGSSLRARGSQVAFVMTSVQVPGQGREEWVEEGGRGWEGTRETREGVLSRPKY